MRSTVRTMPLTHSNIEIPKNIKTGSAPEFYGQC